MSQERVIEIAGVKIALGEDLDQRVRAAMESGKYEEQETRALAASLRPDDVVLELGTGIGLLSAYCAKRIGSDRVFTFEANPELELRIRSTYRLNGVCPRLEMCMLTDREGERDFYLHKAFWASSASADAGAKRVVRVKTRPLNEQIRRINPTILVMDIEGGEYELMQFIDLHNISRVVAEIHERRLGREKADWMIRKFYEAGFRINRELSGWEICCLDRQLAAETGSHLSLEEFLEGNWRLGNHWTAACFEELSALLPPGCRYALVDDDQWGSLQIVPNCTRVPFTENQGQYWGPPADDAAAMRELARMRAQGLQFLIFGPPAFWWLDFYAQFARHVRDTHRLIRHSERFVAFALR
jgi:FkbM family methyltransferase